MKAAIIFTGTGPILILTSYPSMGDANFVNELKAKGIRKFIAFEVPMDLCRNLYGSSYRNIAEELQKRQGMEVLDIDGQRLFNNFTLKKMKRPFLFEERSPVPSKRDGPSLLRPFRDLLKKIYTFG